jgi:membrane protease subunit HflC
MRFKGSILALIVVVGLIVYNAAYIVDETEQVVVTQFGRIIGQPVTTPGLKFKVPFLQKANFFNKNLLGWDGDPGQIPTLDKKLISVDTFARWKIVDPVKFFQTVNNRFNAIGKLNDIIDPAARDFITSNLLIEAVRKSNRDLVYVLGREEDQEREQEREKAGSRIAVGREKLTDGILQQSQPKLAPFGIEIVDVKIKRINYVEEVRKSVYDRMVAERRRIAEKFRSEGKGEAQKILGEMERDLKQINSDAYRVSQELKGQADAEAIRLYAEAYGLSPEFYSFTRTLELYNESFDEKTSLVLSTDSELLKYLKGYSE